MPFVQPFGDLYTYTFIKKGIEMKPFDLEAAKRGEPIVTWDGREVFFVGVSKGSRPVVVCDSAGNLTRLLPDGYYTTNGVHINDIFMAPKKQTVWVNFYKSDDGHIWSNTFKTLDSADNNAIHAPGRVSGKAYPVEIEE